MCIAWNEEYEIGIGLLDGQHRLLAEIVSDLHAEARKGTRTPFLGILVAELRRNAERHFATEGRFLRAGRLLRPMPEARASDLDHFGNCLARIEHHLDAREDALPPDLVAELAAWWRNHLHRTICSLDIESLDGCAA
jgi:hemerythrin